jgi:ABC-type amino acid transport substrate-binding protein
MTEPTQPGRRGALLAAALGAGGVSLLAASRPAGAQLLASGIDEASTLAKVKREGMLRIGFAQTAPWFFKDLKANALSGIFYEMCEQLAKDLEVKIVYSETTFANSTVGLRNGEYDLFGSSLVYTPARALVTNFVGPLWEKGELAITHKDFADRFKSVADFDQPDVIFSLNAGSAEESMIKSLFPKAQVIATTGQIALAAEPVRAKKAHLFVTGDSDAITLAKRNPSWARIVDEAHPFERRIASWVVRYGDPAWKEYLDMWITNIRAGDKVKTLYEQYMARIQQG